MNLFSYGTLQIPEIIRTVTGKTYPGVQAHLPGYAIYRVKNAEYPGIIQSEGNDTPGTLYQGLNEQDINRLDLFEGDLYERQCIEVIQQSGQPDTAWVYIIPHHKQNRLSNEPWDIDCFLKNDFKSFMHDYVNGRQDIYRSNNGNNQRFK